MNLPYAASHAASTAKLEYELLTTHVDDFEQMSYTTYGIRVSDETGAELLVFPDVSTSRECVQSFLDMVKGHDIAALHIPDLLEDFLS